MSAPALSILDLNKSSLQKNGIALGILTQPLGQDLRPVAYFAKLLDSVVKGRPVCLRAAAAMALLVEETTPLDNTDEDWNTDGSSYMYNGGHRAGYTIVASTALWVLCLLIFQLRSQTYRPHQSPKTG